MTPVTGPTQLSIVQPSFLAVSLWYLQGLSQIGASSLSSLLARQWLKCRLLRGIGIVLILAPCPFPDTIQRKLKAYLSFLEGSKGAQFSEALTLPFLSYPRQ